MATKSFSEGAAPLPKVGRYDFMAEPFHCDFRDELFMGHLGNAMLNAADFHSNERGYGMHYLNTIHRTWVLSRLAVEMTRMPKAYEEFSVETWVDAVMRYFTSRNFAVVGRDGSEVYGYGRSVWAMIDTMTRQPVNLLDVRGGLIRSYIDTDTPCPIAPPRRVKVDIDARLARSIDTYYNDVDLNGHVNSVKHIEHVLDLFGIDWYRDHLLRRMEIAYVAESHEGDHLDFHREDMGGGRFAVRVMDGEAEVVRCRLRFEEN